MGLFDGLARRLGYVPARRSAAAGFQMAQQSRLLNDWILSPTTADQNIRRDLRSLRNRSRDLAENEVYLRRFFNMLLRNVIGPQGIRLAMNVRQDDGKPDEDANRRIEEAWQRWGRAGICTSCGTLSWWEVERLVLQSVARDGDMLLRHDFATRVNDFRYALQLLEGDQLDHELNEERRDGRRIKLGVEVNANGRPVAYHLLRRHPGEMYGHDLGSRHDRVPAELIIHPFVRYRVTQTRGVPWVVATGKILKHLEGYQEAAVVAARAGASKMGFIEQEAGGDYTEGREKDDLGRTIEEVEPGILEALPPGAKFAAFDPGYPDGDFGDFVKAILRGVSCGLDVSYASLAGDLSDANYSSMREGKGEEHDAWRSLQRWLIIKLHQPVAEQWLRMAILTGQVNLPVGKLPKFMAGIEWRPRGWAPVDEKKAAEANESGLRNRTATREQIASAAGRDWREDMRQLKREQDFAEELGLREPAPATAPPPAAPSEED